MEKQIWKFQIPVQDYITVEMPKNAEILTVQVQLAVPCIWAIVNTKAPKEQRHFIVRGTGHPMPTAIGNLKYIGTFQMMEGTFVGHLFEVSK